MAGTNSIPLLYDNLVATINANITSTATTITFTSALQQYGTNIATLAGDEYIPLTASPLGDSTSVHAPERLWLTAYMSGATSGTVVRAKEGSTGVAHDAGERVVCVMSREITQLHSMPVAGITGATIAEKTDPVVAGTMRTLMFPADASVMAWGITGDTFARYLFTADPYDGIYIGDGTFDPLAAGVNLFRGGTDFTIYNGDGTHGGKIILTPKAGQAVVIDGVGIKTVPQTSGALSTLGAITSGVAFQVDVFVDRTLVIPVTYNPTAIATATCLVQLSPDNVTFSTLVTVTKPALAALAGDIEPLFLRIPASWYLKLTATNATIGTGTYW